MSGGQRTLPARIALRLERGARRRGLAGAVAQRELPPADIVPRAQLVPDGRIDADETEPERLVQPDAGGVRQGDSGVRGVETLQPQKRDERRVR